VEQVGNVCMGYVDSDVFICKAQPEHYLIAAALCKLKGNEDE